MTNKKAYLEYKAPGFWEIMTQEEYEYEMEFSNFNRRKYIADNFTEFPDFKSAKKRLIAHLRGDRDEAIDSLRTLKLNKQEKGISS